MIDPFLGVWSDQGVDLNLVFTADLLVVRLEGLAIRQELGRELGHA
jgi:hypothetical protein